MVSSIGALNEGRMKKESQQHTRDNVNKQRVSSFKFAVASALSAFTSVAASGSDLNNIAVGTAVAAGTLGVLAIDNGIAYLRNRFNPAVWDQPYVKIERTVASRALDYIKDRTRDKYESIFKPD